jgi:uncharacterized spore protein YtfJ
MGAKEMLQNIGESLASGVTVKSVFGDAIQVGGKTVVPVAKVRFGFGAGAGARGAGHHSNGQESEEGGGGGGGGTAFPVGALEITPTRTRFVPFVDLRLLGGAFALGVLFGRLVWRRRVR